VRFVDTNVLLYAVARDPEELSEELSDGSDYGGVRIENPFS
jgi:predicted nucleic acid-binding protein